MREGVGSSEWQEATEGDREHQEPFQDPNAESTHARYTQIGPIPKKVITISPQNAMQNTNKLGSRKV